ncbi:MAG: MarR family winged helix-turn-helix transcriptional regulator [Faecousia sp.]
MDYASLASQLLSVRANLLQVPAYQHLSKMTKGELFVLNYLVTHETVIHPKELSEKMSVSTARIAFLLHHMEEKGLIVRSSDLSDNRQIIVRLTEDGIKAIQKTRVEVISRVSAMLEGLGPDDAREYIRIQEKILSNFQKTV